MVTQKSAETEHRPRIPLCINVFPKTVKVGIHVNELTSCVFISFEPEFFKVGNLSICVTFNVK